MKNFIEEFYYGNLDPNTRTLRNDSKIKKNMNKLVKNENTLSEKLEGEYKKLFDEYVDTYNKLLADCDLDSFIIGFRMGARFALDTFVNDDSPFTDL